MSRVGKKPIPIPNKTKVACKDRVIIVEGEKGKLTRTIHGDVNLDVREHEIRVTMESESREVRAIQGLTRSLVSNMVTGVSQGFERVLEINGIGYRAEKSGDQIVLNLGYSHPINFEIPEGISVEIDRNNTIKLSGIDKEALGQMAASIRRLRPPEPYKGKGIKYAQEKIQRKAGKTGAK
ncbi:50S ribosomal protein L6 [Desulfococcus sp.]|uniref:50S ribosomal protein L6 n=1 Tax=Desulfococcus sp. TaxID=2025834 RepID=UPI0035936B09